MDWTALEAIDQLCARVYLGLRDDRLRSDDVVELACLLLDRGRYEPAVEEVVARRPDEIGPQRLRELAEQLLDDTAFLPDFRLAPERLVLLEQALGMVAADLPPSWSGPTARLVPMPDSSPLDYKVEFTGGWIHGNGLRAVDAEDLTSALIAVADHVQEGVMEFDWQVWPVCPAHRLGLHPGADGGTAVWQCSLGPHAVAPVGGLPPAARHDDGPRARGGRGDRPARRRPSPGTGGQRGQTLPTPLE